MLLALIIAIGIWEAFWTYKACWLAAELKEKPAFIFFLVFSLFWELNNIEYLDNQYEVCLNKPKRVFSFSAKI